ncbi:MAG TPA: hypothetical protein VF752_00860, partial [Thermoleophilaceae bacterium]
MTPLDPRLDRPDTPPSDLLIKRAHLLDPRAGIDEPADLLVRRGEVAEVGAPGSLEAPEGAEVVDGEGLHAFPAFVDPHVHLRTPGREDEEDIGSGTRAAAAGGFCAILAMPNTDPVTDSASVLLSLRESAGSSSCSASTRPASRWYWSACRITPAERTGSPSSVNAAAPASASS